jgi:predicted alpha-1,2-mannosidase
MRTVPAALLAAIACAPVEPAPPASAPIEAYDPLVWVDPFIATGGMGGEVASVTPGAATPYGMALTGPDTMGFVGRLAALHCAGYWYPDDQIYQFAHTHTHGMGVSDMAAIPVMPRARFTPEMVTLEGRAAPFNHEEESAAPGYYQVVLQDDGTNVEIAATTRGAHHRITFEDTDAPSLLFDLGTALDANRIDRSELEVDLSTGEVTGFQRYVGNYSGRFGGLMTYFSATLDPKPVAVSTWGDDGTLLADESTVAATRAGAVLTFPPGTETVHLRLAISYVDRDGARNNREIELPDLDFDARVAEAAQMWRDQLGNVRVRGGTERDQRIFHTALYHAYLWPQRVDDLDHRYRGMDQAIHTADFNYYNTFSLWDTFRTLHPWMILALPEVQNDMNRSFVRMIEEGGSLPRWPLVHGYTSGMVGTPADQMLAESWLKGVQDWDAETAFNVAYRHSTEPMPHASRSDVPTWLEKGYLPLESSGGSASQTLEYAWSDHSMALWAEAMDRPEAEQLRELSGYWRNVWDPEAGFFHARHADGTFTWSGLEFSWLDDYTEGNAWHYLWYVPFDVPGMIELQHGGDKSAFLARLRDYWDEVYDEEDDILPDDWYWHGNEPVLHVPWLGALAGDRDLTAQASRWVAEHRYDDSPTKGLDGNDDGGTLSAWYLFAALGVYPIAGTDVYALGSPIFERAEIDRGDQTLVFEGPGRPDRAPEVFLGETAWTSGTFTHAELINAGGVRFVDDAEE